jgi:phosphatidylglycerophosphate synthase
MWLAHALTLSRIPIALGFWWSYGDRRWSVALLALAALTDAADGAVARWSRRRTGITTPSAGEWLDPVADKVFVLVAVGAVQRHDPAPWPLICLIVARELVLIPVATVYRLAVHGRGAHAFQAAAIGKAATIAEVCALGALLVYRPALPALAVVAGGLGIAAAVRYVLRARRARL